MKHISIFLASLFLSSAGLQAQLDRSVPPTPEPAKKINIGDYQSFRLDNGLTVILVENHELPTVSFSLNLAIDPVREGRVTGAASMAGSLLKTGTTTRTKAQIDEETDFIGASLSTGLSSIHGSCLKKHQDKILDLMTDILYHPVFPQEEFDKLKKQTLAALAMSASDPNEIASTVANVLRYGKDHPYGEPTTEETIGNITLEDVRNYYKTWFTPSIGYLIMVGDLNLPEAKSLAGKYFAKWKGDPVRFESYGDPPAFSGNRVAFVDKPGAVQSVVTVTNVVRLKPGDPDVMPAYVMNTILGGGVFSGRLMLNLREDKAYTYGAFSSLSTDKLITNFNASAQVRNAVTDSAITQFLFEMKRMRDEPVSAEDLRLAKNVMAGEFGRALENPATLATFALNTFRYHLPADYYSTYLERLERVTVDDVRNMARKYLRPDNCILLVVGNKSDVAGTLTPFATSGKIEYFDRYGNPVEDKPASGKNLPTAEEIVDRYVKAIGGVDNIKKINRITTVATATVEAMGQKMEIHIKSWQIAPDWMVQEMEMNGTRLSRQVYNGKEGWVEAMGQTRDLDGPLLAKMAEDARLFPETTWLTGGYKLKVEGSESVDGQEAWRMSVTSPTGSVSTEYFAVDSGLKIRKIAGQGSDAASGGTVTDYSEYRETGGVSFPFHVKQQVGGQLLDIRVGSVDTTADVDPAIFKK